MRCRWARRSVWCLAVLAVAGGCASSGPRSRGVESTVQRATDPDARWPFWPQSMRIHPLSHFMRHRDTGKLLIEARIEFTDAEGDTSKAAGVIDLQLYDAASDQFVEAGAVSSWSTNLADIAANRDHYDPVTRTYLFRLEVDNVELPDEPELRAYFTSSDGARFHGTYQLPPPQPQ